MAHTRFAFGAKGCYSEYFVGSPADTGSPKPGLTETPLQRTPAGNSISGRRLSVDVSGQCIYVQKNIIYTKACHVTYVCTNVFMIIGHHFLECSYCFLQRQKVCGSRKKLGQHSGHDRAYRSLPAAAGLQMFRDVRA